MRAQAPQPASSADSRPGRSCPTSYRYSPRVFDREATVVADTLYVAGGLYGNVEALQALLALVAAEPGAKLVFNGDFHWFDVADADFLQVSREVLRHEALRGNVETELANDVGDAGCGCAYPSEVSDAEVARSNEILDRLRDTARRHPAVRAEMGALPMHLTARVGEARVGIVHGDAASLAGWGFAHDRLTDPAHERWVESAFRDARVDVFASTHTCLPVLRRFVWPQRTGVIANNGAAGMPNFSRTRHGLVTRISVRPATAAHRVHGMRQDGVHIEAVRLDYNHQRWLQRFLASWPLGSPAYESYHRRIVDGPSFAPPDSARAA